MEKLKFRQIELSDKKLFDNYFNDYQPETSELTFTNIFSWRHAKDYEFAEVDNHILISFYEGGKRKFLQPIGKNPENIIRKILKLCPNSSFERVDEKTAMKLKETHDIKGSRDMFDYIYDTKELSELKGNKFEPKRNLAKQVEKLKPEICPLDESNVHEFFDFQEQWYKLKSCDGSSKSLDEENHAINEALHHFKEFSLCGVCVRIDNQIVGFAIGEKLNGNTYVEHFEKGDVKYKGIYQFVLKEFAKHLPKNFEYLNREQDLGIKGLRKAKESYNPVKMVKKYTVSVK